MVDLTDTNARKVGNLIAQQLRVGNGHHDVVRSTQYRLQPSQAVHLSLEAALGETDGIALVDAVGRRQQKAIEKVAGWMNWNMVYE